MSINFMTAITVHSDFGAQENKICHCFYFVSIYLSWSDGTRCHDLSFLNVQFQASFFTLLFHPHQETPLVPLHFRHKRGVICISEVVISPSNVDPACDLSIPAFLIMYSTYKLNKQSDNIWPCHTPFPIWNQCVVPCPVLTVAAWPAYKFLRRQVRKSGTPISWRIFQFVVIQPVKRL